MIPYLFKIFSLAAALRYAFRSWSGNSSSQQQRSSFSRGVGEMIGRQRVQVTPSVAALRRNFTPLIRSKSSQLPFPLQLSSYPVHKCLISSTSLIWCPALQWCGSVQEEQAKADAAAGQTPHRVQPEAQVLRQAPLCSPSWLASCKLFWRNRGPCLSWQQHGKSEVGAKGLGASGRELAAHEDGGGRKGEGCKGYGYKGEGSGGTGDERWAQRGLVQEVVVLS
eukprot:scaffold16877_cov19-Tisochrysis_lutea.AAC.3